MSDLISRSALKEAFSKNSIFEKITDARGMNVLEIIDEQPTAYDVNEVIRKLEKIKGHYGYYGSEECEYVPYKSAIDIVKRGGVE